MVGCHQSSSYSLILAERCTHLGADAILLPCNICVTCVTSDYLTSDVGFPIEVDGRLHGVVAIGDLTLIS